MIHPYQILHTHESTFERQSLPAAWRTTQLALAQILGLPLKLDEVAPQLSHDIGIHTGTSQHGAPEALQQLLVIMYHCKLQQLVIEMDNAGVDVAQQRNILDRMVEPLSRYGEKSMQERKLVLSTLISLQLT